MDEVKGALSQSQQDLSSTQARRIQLQRENKTLKETVEAHNNKVSDILYQHTKDKEIISDQKHQIKALKVELGAALLTNSEKDQLVMEKNVLIRDQKVTLEELREIGEGQRDKIRDLQEQLELALINSGGSIMSHDGSLSIGINRMSLADELMFENRPNNKAVCMESNAETPTAHLEVSEVQRAEAVHMDLTAEGSGQAQNNSGDNNIVLPVEKSRPFQTALLVSGVVGVALLAIWKLKS
ncbi:uncharacterized protein LOC134455226 [Engraulis encrasicolus]|uniref:uncharacterized protein LOC134455226 n=1 Tax=Engraulis encrasicolus TaxID=184585 RepID=UPI002FD0F20C